MKYLLYFFIGIFLFRFISRYLLPIVQVMRVAGKGMRDIREQMNHAAPQANAGKATPTAVPTRPKEGEYIDYEEIK